MPRNWWPSLDAMSAVIDSEGPWPCLSPMSNGIFVPLDLDKYDGLAVVAGYGRNRHGQEVLGTDEFQEMEPGRWDHLGGGGGGHTLDLRTGLQGAREALHLRISGSSGASLFDAHREFSHAVFVCGSDVAVVKVHRRHGTRVAEVSEGPGWLAVLWTPTDPASVTAYTADRRASFNWPPSGEAV